MNTFWAMICSNAIVAALLAVVATLLGRIWKNPAAMHVLWLVVLLKLFTPPLLTAELPIAGNWLQPATSAALPDRLSLASAADAAEQAADMGPASSRGFHPSGNDQSASRNMARVVADPGVWSPSAWLAALWICGAGGMALRYAIRIRDFAILVRHFE